MLLETGGVFFLDLLPQYDYWGLENVTSPYFSGSDPPVGPARRFFWGPAQITVSSPLLCCEWPLG